MSNCRSNITLLSGVGVVVTPCAEIKDLGSSSDNLQSPEDLNRQALVAIASKQQRQARSLLNQALALCVEGTVAELFAGKRVDMLQMRAVTLCNYSLLLRTTKKYRLALEMMEECISMEESLEMSSPASALNLSALLLELHRCEEALLIARRAARLSIDNPALRDRASQHLVVCKAAYEKIQKRHQ